MGKSWKLFPEGNEAGTRNAREAQGYLFRTGFLTSQLVNCCGIGEDTKDTSLKTEIISWDKLVQAGKMCLFSET